MKAASGRRLGLIGLVLGTAIAATVYLVVGMERAAYIDSYRTAAINLGTGMASQTDRMLGQIDAALRLALARVASVPDANPARIGAELHSAALQRMLDAAKLRLATVDFLEIFDADGALVGSAGAAPVMDASVREVVRHFTLEDDPSSYVGAPVKSPTTDKWSVFLARRINVGGQFAGIVGADLSLTELEDFYRSAMPPKRILVLARRDGLILVRNPYYETYIGLNIPTRSPFYERVVAGGGSFDTHNFLDGTGAALIAFLQPMQNAPLVVEVFGLESEALAGWYVQRIWVMLCGVAAELVMIFLLWLFGSQLRRLEASESLLALNNRQLETARLQLDAALSNISQGLCFFGGDRKLILGNRRHNELYHLPREAAVAGTTLEQTIRWYRAGGAPDALGDALLALSDTGARADRPTQLVIDMSDGRVIAIALQPMPDGGWVATHEDITERRRVESQIAYLAQHDSLTGLANRALLGEQITRAMEGRTRGIGFALLFLDLDRFKAVNDTYGHGAGDQLLQLVAKRLLHSLREVDSAARLGGDEFVVLQVGLNGPEDAGQLARRIIGLLSLPYPINGHDILIGVSVGIELADNASGDIEVLIKNADSALYTAKQAGRGTYRYFRPADFVEAAPPDDL